MIHYVLSRLFGSRNQRLLKRLYNTVAVIKAQEATIASLSDLALRAKTAEFRDKLQQGCSLEQLLPEAFAVVREAASRTVGMRHFDVQLIGGIVLHSGNIAEMRTGEGKTLVSTLAAYLNALPQLGVHVVTVNDYLAQRDAAWMAPIYEFLDLTVGVITANMSVTDKQRAYAADITYGTNHEFGFDYLRDNMALDVAEKVQRGNHYAIIDEVDSILVDEARTPLIISGPAEENTELYAIIDSVAGDLAVSDDQSGDYYLEEKSKQVHLTERGQERAEELFMAKGLLGEGNLYDAHHIMLLHHLRAALKAHNLLHKDVDYIVQKGEVVIVDEHTGRAMVGRRWSDGLHQAVEVKEGVKVHPENQTLASVTFQNYFRAYDKLAGMTGTADTEAYELQHIYGLEVVVIPPNKPSIRKDLPDLIYINRHEKFQAIVADIKAVHATKQPILVGTTSIDNSEFLSGLLQQEHIPHQVLNAKYHEQEAAIIAQAGRPGAVTIATNMAGRGTDIVLGGKLVAELSSGHPEPDDTQDDGKHYQEWRQRHDAVVALGGLYVLGTERHESRRIDNQLRGRSGRQGDPGVSRFYLSLEDNLLRIFGGNAISNLMKSIGVEQNTAMESRLLSRSIENAQRKVEEYHFDVRKQLLEYDDVINEQRTIIYQQRQELLISTDFMVTLELMIDTVVSNMTKEYWVGDAMPSDEQLLALLAILQDDFACAINENTLLRELSRAVPEHIEHHLKSCLNQRCQEQLALMALESITPMLRMLMLQFLDKAWREHLAAMDYLRQGIHLRGYAQKNPKQEYKLESFNLFAHMLNKIHYEIVAAVCKLNDQVAQIANFMISNTSTYAMDGHDGAADLLREPELLTMGRNQPCFCQSGKKYKHCHGKL